jgi:hypothetical protein
MTEDDWARVCALIQSALDRGGNTHALEHVFQGWRAGVFQLWISPTAVVVTEVLRPPLKTELNYWLAAGDLAGVEALEPTIEAFARAAGCSRVRANGVRRGGSRTMRGHGFAHQWDVMVKELT